jgi:hypothetical protein
MKCLSTTKETIYDVFRNMPDSEIGEKSDMGTNMFLDLSGIENGSPIVAFLSPLWFKMDPGSSATFCYLSHFITYVVSWVLVGDFVFSFLWDAFTQKFPIETAKLGVAALATQSLYSMLVLICGLAEESRTSSPLQAKCFFRRRYLANFTMSMVLGAMWTLTGAAPVKYVRFPGEAHKTEVSLMMSTEAYDSTPPKNIQIWPAVEMETLEFRQSGERKVDDDKNDDNNNKKDKDNKDNKDKDGKDKETTENKDNKDNKDNTDGGKHDNQSRGGKGDTKDLMIAKDGLIKRLVSRKMVVPFIAAILASLLVYGILC